MDATAIRAFGGSEDAERVRRLVAEVASNWLPSETQRDGVDALVQAALYMARNALVPELRLWNARNDRMARLPVELRLHCFSFTSSSGLLAASSVCFAWKELICGTVDLWEDLDFTVAPLPSAGELAHALRLSQGRLVSVSALVRNQTERRALDEALAVSCLRLRSLHIDHGSYHLACDYYAFRRPMPELESLTYLGPDRLVCWPLLFNDRAPKLTRLRSRAGLFRHKEFERWAPLAIVRTLIMGRGEVMPMAFFTLLPNLRSLTIDDIPPVSPFCLPHLPAEHPLTHLRLKRYALGTGSALREHGFMRVQRLEVEGYCAEVLAIALSQGGSLALTADVTEKTLSISLTPDEPHAAASGVFFSSDGFPSCELHRLFHAPADAEVFDSLTALTLPRDFPPHSIYATDERFNAALHQTIFPRVPLQRLRTLTLLCGPRAGDALLDAHVLQQCGVLVAPALARLVLRRVRRGAEPVCPLGLAFFISHHLRIERPALLEVVVERELGFVDRDDSGAAIEVLESYVGSLTVQAL